MLFTTNNQVLLRTYKPLPALNCIQYNATKKKVTEEDDIKSNKAGFGSKIGSITNRITQMTSLMSNYKPGDREYEVLRYRTQCGQAQQQAEIDAVKGIISNSMPKSWYIYSENKIDYDNDSLEEIERKKLYQRICAHKKPYFFSYNYSYLRKEYNDYIANINAKSCSMFQLNYVELINKAGKTDKERQFIQWAENKMPLDMSPSVMNKLCNMVENELDGLSQPHQEHFDPSMIKSGYKYLHATYKSIEQLYKQYKAQISEATKKKKCEYYLRYENDDDEGYQDVDQIKADFAEKCGILCPNRHELCDILIDLCYTGRASKDIVWDVCGDTIIENLLKNNNYNLYYPEKVTSEEEFECCGSKFIMKKIKFGGDIE